MAREPRRTGPTPVEAFEHTDETRKNIPTADGADRWVDPADLQREPVTYTRFAGFADERAARNEALDPQLVWRGKDLQDDANLVVDAPPLYIQEKIDPRALVENLRKTAAAGQPEPEATLFDFFDGDLDELQQIEYYQHDAKWTNRMILGDSLQAMGSLAEREGLRGKVQMIYIDPPYGIKFNSNWQVSARKRDVKDGKDAAREAEQIKAFRDTWKDGIHTYLSYLRDRLVAARDLLSESGSVFVQIGDENVHRVRVLLDEVFGGENLVSQIPFIKTSSTGGNYLDGINDYLLWYAKDKKRVKFRRLYVNRGEKSLAQGYTWIDQDGERRRLKAAEIRANDVSGRRFASAALVSTSGGETTDFEYEYEGIVYRPSRGSFWKTNRRGMEALEAANRLVGAGSTLNYVRYADDFPVVALNSWWGDTKESTFAVDKIYVVQTYTKVVERCMMLCTDPGDLVLDPTCGSGTTAYVAEQWGRRWITMDTSRVALALARQRLMGGRYPYYLLADTDEGRKKLGEVTGKPLPPAPVRGDIRQGFVYERVQHITLKSIANNPDIREGMTREQIDAAIKKHAEYELLYDKPYEDKKRVRVTGPFTVESLSPYRSLDQRTEPSRSEQRGEAEPRGADYAQTILENLQTSGIQNGRRQERIEFVSVEPHAGTHVQAIAERAGEDEAPSHVAIAIGPEYGTVSAAFVRDAAREAIQDGDVDLLCVLGFSFDPNVTSMTGDDITVGEDGSVEVSASEEGFANVAGERKLGKLKVLIVRMNADLLMGEALKKTGSGNLFTVFGEPDVDIREIGDQLEVELRGVDVYDAAKGEIRAADTSQVALWMIDTDYNEESFFVRHCYFTGGGDPMKKLKTALKADIDADAWAQLYRTTSMPFARPSTGKIAVKVINDYGDEVMKVYEV